MRGHEQIPLYEMRKEQQEVEDAREVRGSKVQVENIAKKRMRESTTWREERIRMARLGVVQEVFWVCSVLSGTEADEPLEARTEGHEGAWKHVEKNLHERKRRGLGQEY